jgi:hypothetical protein
MSAHHFVILSSPPSAQPNFAVTPPGTQTVDKSPPRSRFFDGQVIPNSSASDLPPSSDLPSPSAFFQVPIDQSLKTGSLAESISEVTIPSGRTVAGLVKARRLSTSGDLDEDTVKKPAAKKATNPHQRKVDKKADESAPVKPARKKRVPKVEVGGDAAPKKPRKRLTKSNENGVTTVAKGKKRKRTKPEPETAVGEPTAEKRPHDGALEQAVHDHDSMKKAGTVSSHFGTGRSREVIADASNPPESPLQLGIPIAVKRRRDWTPTKETAAIDAHAENTGIYEFLGSPSNIVSPAQSAKTSFSSILGGFAYSNNPPSVNPECGPKSNVESNKRRKIDVRCSESSVISGR